MVGKPTRPNGFVLRLMARLPTQRDGRLRSSPQLDEIDTKLGLNIHIVAIYLGYLLSKGQLPSSTRLSSRPLAAKDVYVQKIRNGGQFTIC